MDPPVAAASHTPGPDARVVLDAMAADPSLAGRLVHLERLPPRPARYATLEQPLHPGVAERLAARGSGQLWVHQARAVDHLRAGGHVVLATGTASGKSLCYQLPIVSSVLAGEKDTALLVFPTKALAHDQLRSLRSWAVPGLGAVTYDGDTPPEERAWARRHANVVLTNPEMLHAGMLPYHDRWATFLMRLRYVVVDELHTLRGIFGSHAALLLRRLRRVCERYGSTPSFCFASATIGNPAELASQISGLDVLAVDDDGSPKGERLVVLWDRPVPVGAHAEGLAADSPTGAPAAPPSAHQETAALLARFVDAGLRTIAFCGSRKGAELVARAAQRRVGAAGASSIAVYRGGFLPEERRALERDLGSGALMGVAATNALELGIDVAGLDAVICNGFPGTLASFWQQAGRAGRALQPSAAVLVAGDDLLDRWYLDHPREVFTRALEPAVINPSNPFVVRPHVGCAAYELPLGPDDLLAREVGEPVDDAVRDLVLADRLRPRDGLMYWSGGEPPNRSVGLRTGSSHTFRLVETGTSRLVGTVDESRVFSLAHPGAVYLHQGRQYRVEGLDLDDGTAWLGPADGDEYTVPRSDVDIAITGCDETRTVGRSTAHLGAVVVTTTVSAYQRRLIGTGKVIETVDLDLPPRPLDTRACWYTVPFEVVEAAGVDLVRVLGAVHAAEHAMIGMLPLFAICDRWDVGGVSMALHPATGEPTIFVYDGYPGGAGIAELAFAAADRHLAVTLEVVAGCACQSGCPSCVQSPKCGNWNEYLDKAAALALLRAVLSASGPETPG